ncbi:hypothetical protein M3J09_013385 [Ascochyta lentis]
MMEQGFGTTLRLQHPQAVRFCYKRLHRVMLLCCTGSVVHQTGGRILSKRSEGVREGAPAHQIGLRDRVVGPWCML